MLQEGEHFDEFKETQKLRIQMKKKYDTEEGVNRKFKKYIRNDLKPTVDKWLEDSKE